LTPEENALAKVVGRLDDIGVPHMLTGSVRPATTAALAPLTDTDIVVDPTPLQMDTLVQHLAAADFYVDREGAHEALRDRRPFTETFDPGHAAKGGQTAPRTSRATTTRRLQ
jgi:hypothetical protein